MLANEECHPKIFQLGIGDWITAEELAIRRFFSNVDLVRDDKVEQHRWLAQRTVDLLSANA